MRACHLHKIAKSLQGGDNEIGALEEKWKFLEEMVSGPRIPSYPSSTQKARLATSL